MKAGGVNFISLIIPVLTLSALLTYALFVFNDRVLPVANHHARVMKKNIQTKRPTLTIEPGIYLEGIENFSMIVENKDELGVSIFGITIYDKTQRDAARTITARSGTVEIDETDDSMVLTLENGEIHDMNPRKPDQYQRVVFNKYRVIVPVENLSLKKTDESFHNEREKNISQLMEDVRRHKFERDKQLERAVAAIEKNPALIAGLDEKSKGHFQRYLEPASWLTGINDFFTTINLTPDTVDKKFKTELPDTLRQILQFVRMMNDSSKLTETLPLKSFTKADTLRMFNTALKNDSIENIRSFGTQQVTTALNSTNNYQRLMDQLMVEVNKKYSIPVACIVFVMLGAPIGVRARKGNLGIAGGISLFFFIAYYFCLILGENFADRQLLNPFVAMWFMNVFLGALGILLIYQTSSERDFGIVSLMRTVTNKLTFFAKKFFRRVKM
jgi:lipopolysaccharide export system permease protein